MSENWDRFRNLINDGIKVTKEALSSIKTAANTGSKKMSLYMLRSKLKDRFAELGSFVYRQLEEENNKSIASDNKSVKIITDEIKNIKDYIAKTEKEIQNESASTAH